MSDAEDRSAEDRPAFLNSAGGVVADAWERLAEGAARGRHAFHTPVLASVGLDGVAAARTVVLRGCDPGKRRLLCHSDARAPKIAELLAQPDAAWLFYDKEAKLQIRASATHTVHRVDALADRQWEATGASSRRCYLAPATPGTVTADGGPSPNLPPTVRGRVPEPEETLPGREHFAVIAGQVLSLDVLHLHHAGHVRVSVAFGEGGHGPRFVEP